MADALPLDPGPLTLLLQRADESTPSGQQQAFVAVYAELRRLAGVYLQGERKNHTLQPTALVHEAFLKLVGSTAVQPFQNREQFFAAAAIAMRRILVDHARTRTREKRGGGRVRMPIDAIDLATNHAPEVVLGIDAAITELQGRDPQLAELARLRLFAGLTEIEIAEVMSSSERTVRRDWALARAVLRRALGDAD